MTYHILLAWMIFMHIFADFCLQGVLSDLKQKSWWEQNCPDKMYKDDYIMALLLHSFSWAFCIQLPILIYTWGNVNWIYMIMLLVNTFIHELVDNLKANEKRIDLTTDQFIHLAQVIVTATIFAIAYY